MSIDAALGRLGNKSGVCTSSTRPTNPFEGQLIYETDTNRTLVYDNAAWLVVADNQVLSIDSANGRVGIGTDTPESNLDINGNTPSLLFTSPNDTNRYRIDANISDAADFGMSLGYWDGSAYQRTLTVDATGKVGIKDTAPSYPLDVNGDINATGDLRIGGNAIGTWNDWTPSFTNLTLGNGVVEYARYVQINKLVVAQMNVTLGSTSSVTGDIRVSLPVTAAIFSGAPQVTTGVGRAFDNSTSSVYWLTPYIVSPNTEVRVYATATTSTYAYRVNTSATVPMTWGTNDALQISLRYEAA